MVGGADILAAGLAYTVPDWKTFIITASSIGVIATIASFITVQLASQNILTRHSDRRKLSSIKEVSLVWKRFFSSCKIIKTTVSLVS